MGITRVPGRILVIAAFGATAAAADAQTIGMASPAPEKSGKFGGAVASVADVNGDGKADIIVGARAENPAPSPVDAGRVHIYSGATGAKIRTLKSPAEVFLGSFGYAVAGVPDCDGDGRGEVLVGAPFEGFGKAYLFSGKTGVLLRTFSSPNGEMNGAFGTAVAGVADLNGDARGDVVIGAPFESPGAAPLNSGRAYVYSGKTGSFIRQIVTTTPVANGKFGCSVSGVPDVNGDGRGDVLVGALGETTGKAGVTNDGRARLYSGANGVLLRSFISPQRETAGEFGSCVAGTPDMTGDGKGDILISAPDEDPGNYPEGTGRVYVYNGATGALVRQLTSPNYVADGRYGHSAAGIPDMTGDGKADIVIGAKNEAPGLAKAGRAYIYNGATGALVKTLVSPNKEAGGEFGVAVCGIADTNANAKGDVIVGAWNEDPGAAPDDSGRAYLFRQ